MMKNYLPGYAVTQDFIFFEESGEALNAYHDKFGNNRNVFFYVEKSMW